MLSVIVPIFRVEKYLDKCVQSILAQTYKDLEIILVDDGSDDGCPAMCDAYAKTDSRIRVVHKENGGLSDARNAGLEIATGEYIAFADSDDYVHPQMYEAMVSVMEKEKDVDMVVCPFQKVDEDENDANEKVSLSEKKYRVLKHEEVITQMFKENYEMYIVAWDKVFRKTMWENLRFPVGRIHEDQFTTYKPLYESRKVGLMEEKLYYYRIRNNSIMGNYKAKASLDDIDALREKMEYFSTKEEWEYAACASRSLEHMVYHYHKAKKSGAEDVAKQIREIFLKDWKYIKKEKINGIPKERKAYFNSFSISDRWMQIYMKFYWKCLSLKRKIKP